MSHWLVILEQGEDYEIEHEPECPRVELWDGPDGAPIMGYSCLLGALITEAGLDYDIDWRKLAVGRYEIEAWSQHYSSTPWRAEEWEAGIRLAKGDPEMPHKSSHI